MNSQCNWGKNVFRSRSSGLYCQPIVTCGTLLGLSCRKALAGWHTKAVADIQNRGSYKAKAVGTSPNAARTNCDIFPLGFIWFNDLASSQFLFRLFHCSWRTFCPLPFLLLTCIYICMHPCWSISLVEIRRQKCHTMRVSKLQGQSVGYVPKQSVGYPKVLIMSLGKVITRVLVPGICECSWHLLSSG